MESTHCSRTVINEYMGTAIYAHWYSFCSIDSVTMKCTSVWPVSEVVQCVFPNFGGLCAQSVMCFLSTIQEGLPAPVEWCCKFLCSFARVSSDNQRALFDHISYLLEHSEKNAGLVMLHLYCVYTITLIMWLIYTITLINVVHGRTSKDVEGRFYS
jgi:hypothetical protein